MDNVTSSAPSFLLPFWERTEHWVRRSGQRYSSTVLGLAVVFPIPFPMHLTRLEEDVDEETPFLQNEDTPRKPAPTPLPRTQIAILLSVWIADSVVSHSIGPYLNQV